MSETIRYPLARTGRGRGEGLTELDRTPGTRRRELHHPGRRDVQPPPEPPVKLFRAVDVRNGDDDHLQLHVDFRDVRVF